MTEPRKERTKPSQIPEWLPPETTSKEISALRAIGAVMQTLSQK